jgi:hypothetical protein
VTEVIANYCHPEIPAIDFQEEIFRRAWDLRLQSHGRHVALFHRRSMMQRTRSTLLLLGIGIAALSLTAAAQTGVSSSAAAGTAANATGTASGGAASSGSSSVGGGLGVSGAGSTATPSGAPSIPGAGATGSTSGAIVIQPSTPMTPSAPSVPNADFNSGVGVGAFSNPSGAGLGVGGTSAFGITRPGTR